jgi:hypothetical protein
MGYAWCEIKCSVLMILQGESTGCRVVVVPLTDTYPRVDFDSRWRVAVLFAHDEWAARQCLTPFVHGVGGPGSHYCDLLPSALCVHVNPQTLF